MTNWAKVIQEAKEKAEEQAEKIFKDAAIRIVTHRFIPESPVWSGRYISNFHFTEGAPASAQTMEFEPGGAGGVKRSEMQASALGYYAVEFGRQEIKTGKTYFITNTMEYSLEIEVHGSVKYHHAQGMFKSVEVLWEGYVAHAARERRTNGIAPF